MASSPASSHSSTADDITNTTKHQGNFTSFQHEFRNFDATQIGGAVSLQKPEFQAAADLRSNFTASELINAEPSFDNVAERFERLEIGRGIKNLQESSDRQEKLVGTVISILKKHPEIVPKLTTYEESLGAPTMQLVNEALQQASEVSKTNEGLVEENRRLRQQLAVRTHEESLRQAEPDWRTNDIQTISGNLSKLRKFSQSVLFRPDENFEVDWDLLENAFLQASIQADTWEADDIVSDASNWLSRIQGLCDPISTNQSALQCAARLLALSFSDHPTSLADIQTLAKKLTSLETQELKLPLAYLQSALCRKSQLVVVEDVQLSNARALIILRGIELFHDHIRRVRELQTLDTVFDEIRPYLAEACKRSNIVNALVSYLSAVFSGRPESLISRILDVASPTMQHEQELIFMDGDNFVMVNASTIQVVRPHNVQLDATGKGWIIVCQQPPWRSRYFAYSELDDMERVFCNLLDRLTEDNPSIILSEAELRFSER